MSLAGGRFRGHPSTSCAIRANVCSESLDGLAGASRLREVPGVDAAAFVGREAFERLRGERDFAWQGDGIWVCGSLEGLRRPCVAIVGTRAATGYGRRLARVFAAELGRAGCCIVSGLALGIDGEAHAGALEAGAPTVGVLGSGHGQFFPKRNAALAERMAAAGGAVLSSYPPALQAQPWQFLARNGLVAALSDAVVVIEAPARSGALNTAQWAAPRIPVFAVPGDVDRRHVAGCHALIRDGAILARDAADVLEVLRVAAPRPLAPAIAARDGLAGRIVAALSGGERSLDELADASGAAAAELLAALAMLELEGAVERRGADRFACTCV
jgi:DNA processing protein